MMPCLQDLVLEYGDAQANFASGDAAYGSPAYKSDQRRYLMACKALQEYVRANLPVQEDFTIHNDHLSQTILDSLQKETI